MRRRFRKGVELTDRQFAEQPWVYGSLTYAGSILYLKDGPVHGNPPPYAMLYKPCLKALGMDTISFSGIELDGKVWVAQVWYCECYSATPPAGTVKLSDGTLERAPTEGTG